MQNKNFIDKDIIASFKKGPISLIHQEDFLIDEDYLANGLRKKNKWCCIRCSIEGILKSKKK